MRQDPNNATYAGFVDMTATPPQTPQPIPALAMVAALVFVVAAIAAVVVYDRKPELFRSQGTISAAQHGSGSAADPPPDHMDRDGQFLWRLSTQGLRLRRSKDAAINDARRICARYAGGESEQQIIQDMLAGSRACRWIPRPVSPTRDQRVLPERLYRQPVIVACATDGSWPRSYPTARWRG